MSDSRTVKHYPVHILTAFNRSAFNSVGSKRGLEPGRLVAGMHIQWKRRN